MNRDRKSDTARFDAKNAMFSAESKIGSSYEEIMSFGMISAYSIILDRKRELSKQPAKPSCEPRPYNDWSPETSLTHFCSFSFCCTAIMELLTGGFFYALRQITISRQFYGVDANLI